MSPGISDIEEAKMTSCKTAFPQFSQKENQMTQLLKPSVTPGSKKESKRRHRDLM